MLAQMKTWNPRKLARLATATAKYGPTALKVAREAIVEQKALQRTLELTSVVGLVKALRPKVIVEIGTKDGGTLYCWTKVAPEGAFIVSVDLPGGGPGYTKVDD